MEMEKLVSLCKRRGFLFQSSEIYGGLNGFWDYGPLGVELKRNIKEAWWRDMVTGHDDLAAPPGAPMPTKWSASTASIIMHPQVWKCSGHYDLFVDMMVDCKAEGCKGRFRVDHIPTSECPLKPSKHPGEHDKCQLTEPRDFNLMFKTIVGALGTRRRRRVSAARNGPGHLRQLQERLRQHARAACRSASPRWARAFATKSRRGISRSARASSSRWRSSSSAIPSSRRSGIEYWRDRRMKWYTDLGLAGERLRLREHDKDELSHYSCGTADIEYAFPFLAAGEFGELEGIAHRGDFDLRSHMEGKLVAKRRPARWSS